VIENPSPETSTDGEEAPQTTTHGVSHSACFAMWSNIVWLSCILLHSYLISFYSLTSTIE